MAHRNRSSTVVRRILPHFDPRCFCWKIDRRSAESKSEYIPAILYGKASKMDPKEFVTRFDMETFGLLGSDTLRSGLLSKNGEKRTVRAELYKLNVYGQRPEGVDVPRIAARRCGRRAPPPRLQGIKLENEIVLDHMEEPGGGSRARRARCWGAAASEIA